MILDKEKYCDFLYKSQINYTGTYFLEHWKGVGRNAVYHFLKDSKIGSEDIWDDVKEEIIYSKNGCIIFDDTVLDKSYSFNIEPVRKQYSGNAHGVIKGIGVVNCVYFNPELDRFWAIDMRIFDPDTDGKTKLDHVSDMLDSLMVREVIFNNVLMDTWYATRDLMLKIDDLGKLFYCPVKTNRLAKEHSGESYRQVGSLEWNQTELVEGKTVKFKDFPKRKLLKLFCVVVSTNQIDYLVTNDLSEDYIDNVLIMNKYRWKIEQFHRELKQITGIERCQCRLNQSQRNHISCAILLWNALKTLSYLFRKTVYEIKRSLLNDYMKINLNSDQLVFK
jgi:hypothetical protein